MKAERRHDLQTNTLAQFLSDIPLYVRFHGNKILVGVIVLCLLILLLQYRIRTAREARAAAQGSLVSARNGVLQLANIDAMQPNDSARFLERGRLAGTVNDAIEAVLDNSDDKSDAALRAEALITKGDLYWTQANLPPLAGAATMPSIAPKRSSSELLDDAAGAYQRVVASYSNLPVPYATALLGLAAIDENRENWDKVVEQYTRIATDPNVPDSFKMVARQRIAMVPQLRMPVYLEAFATTQPAATLPATTMDSAPTTVPATRFAPTTTAP